MNVATQEPISRTSGEVLELAVSICHPNPRNKMRPLDEPFLQSLRDYGQLVIGLVRPHPDKDGEYDIINGARRRTGLETIGSQIFRAELRQVDDKEADELRAIENKQRVGLSWRQELEEIEEYLGRYPEQYSSIAGALGISANQVKRRHGLLKKLSKSWMKAIKAGKFESWTVDHFESLIPFTDKQQESFYLNNFQWNDEAISVKDLREQLAEDTHSLKAVPWDLNDVTVCPSAGSCADCPKRSGANTDLFDEVDPKIKGQDRCLDEECFEKKKKAFVESKVAELRREDPEVVAVSKMSHQVPAGTIGSDDYKIVKANTKGAKKAVQVDGTGAGQVVYVQLNAEAKKEAARMAAGQPKKSLAERKAVREKQRDALAIEKLITYIEDEAGDLEFEKFAHEVMVQYCLVYGVAAADSGSGRMHDEEKRAMEFDSKPITEAELWEAVKDSMVGKLKYVIGGLSMHSEPAKKDSTVILCAWMVDADFAALRAEALAELPDPKSWASEEVEAKSSKPAKKSKASAAAEDDDSEDLGAMPEDDFNDEDDLPEE